MSEQRVESGQDAGIVVEFHVPVPFVEDGKVLLVEQLRKDFVECSRVVVLPFYVLIQVFGIEAQADLLFFGCDLDVCNNGVYPISRFSDWTDYPVG